MNLGSRDSRFEILSLIIVPPLTSHCCTHPPHATTDPPHKVCVRTSEPGRFPDGSTTLRPSTVTLGRWRVVAEPPNLRRLESSSRPFAGFDEDRDPGRGFPRGCGRRSGPLREAQAERRSRTPDSNQNSDRRIFSIWVAQAPLSLQFTGSIHVDFPGSSLVWSHPRV